MQTTKIEAGALRLKAEQTVPGRRRAANLNSVLTLQCSYLWCAFSFNDVIARWFVFLLFFFSLLFIYPFRIRLIFFIRLLSLLALSRMEKSLLPATEV